MTRPVLIKYVGRDRIPFAVWSLTFDSESKLDPATEMTNPLLPAWMLEGVMLVIV
jgi:hypothetical protein